MLSVGLAYGLQKSSSTNSQKVTFRTQCNLQQQQCHRLIIILKSAIYRSGLLNISIMINQTLSNWIKVASSTQQMHNYVLQSAAGYSFVAMVLSLLHECDILTILLPPIYTDCYHLQILLDVTGAPFFMLSWARPNVKPFGLLEHIFSGQMPN